MDQHVAQTDRFVRGFTEQLRRSGLRHVVIAPGSRSTPLTLAFARDSSFIPWLHLDERSAGYFALGLARELGEPVGLVCTSGTAAANFLPAVVEASLSRIPLVVLTADRPPELRHVGANQAIDQVRLYGSHVKWAVELPLPDGSAALERYARSTAARVTAMAIESPAGPVHVNAPFREPMVDVAAPGERTPASESVGSTEVARASAEPPVAAIAELAESLAGRRGLLLAGPASEGLPAAGLAALADSLGWPILADPLSGVRAGHHDLSRVIDNYDVLVREPGFAAAMQPEVIIRFGGAMTSKPLNGYLAARPAIRQVVVDVPGGWLDPDAGASLLIHGDPQRVVTALTRGLRGSVAPAGPEWCAAWVTASAVTRAALREAVDALTEPFEGRAPLELAEVLPDGATLVAGNSMPVRDIDTFLPVLPRDIRIVGTRGASGIDGVVSTAAGAAAARTSRDGREQARRGPVVLLIGDLSFFHDLNGLWPARRYGLDLTVLLVHNDGGGIFHFLPQATAAPDRFEEWFGTPHGMDFHGAVEMHGGRYSRLDGPRDWAEPVRDAIEAGGLHVLELRTDRQTNVPLHRQVVAHAHAALVASRVAPLAR